MKQWIVSWSNDGVHWSQENMRIFEGYEAATWFAKTQENEYNYVRMHEVKDGI